MLSKPSTGDPAIPRLRQALRDFDLARSGAFRHLRSATSVAVDLLPPRLPQRSSAPIELLLPWWRSTDRSSRYLEGSMIHLGPGFLLQNLRPADQRNVWLRV